MKRHSKTLKPLLLTIALAAIAISLVWAPRSTATSGTAATAESSAVQDEKGTIVARLKDYDPAVHGYGFRNYGRDHEGENDLTAGDLIKIFGAENVCESGNTASDCVLYEPAEEWRAERIKAMEVGHCEGFASRPCAFGRGCLFETKRV